MESTEMSASLGGATVLGQRTDLAFNTFLGTMDDTAFYNYALSAAAGPGALSGRPCG